MSRSPWMTSCPLSTSTAAHRMVPLFLWADLIAKYQISTEWEHTYLGYQVILFLLKHSIKCFTGHTNYIWSLFHSIHKRANGLKWCHRSNTKLWRKKSEHFTLCQIQSATSKVSTRNNVSFILSILHLMFPACSIYSQNNTLLWKWYKYSNYTFLPEFSDDPVPRCQTVCVWPEWHF